MLLQNDIKVKQIYNKEKERDRERERKRKCKVSCADSGEGLNIAFQFCHSFILLLAQCLDATIARCIVPIQRRRVYITTLGRKNKLNTIHYANPFRAQAQCRKHHWKAENWKFFKTRPFSLLTALFLISVTTNRRIHRLKRAIRERCGLR